MQIASFISSTDFLKADATPIDKPSATAIPTFFATIGAATAVNA
jgi:hypothetical protein